ncbi:hypothetical protein [Streptomyces sp. NPDC056194]|uniref:hypothetical protein n=1 Tax=unclassified Streptomyces TaxID=2593676 RepID=UPI0035D7BEFD
MGSAYVVELAERFANTSILRPCNRAISNAAAVESAEEAADLADLPAAVARMVAESAAAKACPLPSDTNAASATSTAATASAVRLGDMPATRALTRCLNLNTTPVITP